MGNGLPTVEATSLALAGLLPAARHTYGLAVRAALADAQMDDLPRNGGYVLLAVARGMAPLGDVVRSLGVSKQAVGQLIDALAVREYLERLVDPADRRRTTLHLTERGRYAADVVRTAVRTVDEALTARVGPDQIAVARQVLATLVELGQQGLTEGSPPTRVGATCGQPPPARS